MLLQVKTPDNINIKQGAISPSVPALSSGVQSELVTVDVSGKHFEKVKYFN